MTSPKRNSTWVRKSDKQEAEALRRISQTLGSTLDLNAVLQCIINEAIQLFAAQSASVILHDKSSNEAELTTTYGGETSERHTLRFPLAGSLTGWVAEHQRPLRIFRLTPEEWPTAWRLGEQLGEPPVHVSVLLVPLWMRGKVMGSLEVVWTPHHRITDHEEQLLEAVAGQAAIAIANARLYQEKERALQEMRESEERYRRLVELSPEAIAVYCEEKLVYINAAGVNLFGAPSPEDLIGKPIWEFVHPDSHDRVKERGQQIPEEEKEAGPSEEKFVRLDGRVIDVEVVGIPTAYQGKSATQLVVRDITERKRAEQRTVALLDVAKDISGTLDLHELLDRVQRRMAEMLPCDIVATFYRDSERQTFRIIAQHGIPGELLSDAQALEFPLGQPFDGRVASGQTVVINEPTEQSGFLATLLAHFRITALVAVPLLVRGRYLGALTACTTTAGHRFDPAQVELCNGITRQLAVGIEATELYHEQHEEAAISSALARIGRELIASLDTPTILDHLCQLTAEVLEGNYSCTFLWQPKEGGYTPVAGWGHTVEQQAVLEVLKVPPGMAPALLARLQSQDTVEAKVPGSEVLLSQVLWQQLGIEQILFLALRHGQELIGFQACGYRQQKVLTSRHFRIARGITQLASLALTNAKLLEELDRANRLKDDFVSTMSHELRTPIHIILGYTELLREGTFGLLATRQTEALRQLEKSAKELLDLVNATLDLSRLQSRQIPLQVQEVEVADLLTELAAEIDSLNRKADLQIEWQTERPLPALHTDPIKLKMVLKNLITNALKFTERGCICVMVRPHREGIEFSVSDTGIGIAPEVLPIIFEPFRQGDSSMTRRHGGVGLGLYIVRQLTELLGGTVSVDSEVGKGSTFRVWLPQGSQHTPGTSVTEQRVRP